MSMNLAITVGASLISGAAGGGLTARIALQQWRQTANSAPSARHVGGNVVSSNQSHGHTSGGDLTVTQSVEPKDVDVGPCRTSRTDSQ